MIFGNDRVKANNTDDLGFWFEKQSCDIYRGCED